MLVNVYVLYPIELEDISYVITLPTNAHHGPAWSTTAHSIALFGPLQPTTAYYGLLRSPSSIGYDTYPRNSIVESYDQFRAFSGPYSNIL